MPEIVDDVVETTTIKPVETSETTESTEGLSDVLKPVKGSAATETTKTVTTTEEQVPDKYKGKTLAQVVEMHQNAESMAGRQSQEVGELRSIVDDFIKGASQSTKKESDEDPIDILDDPAGAVNQLIKNHPDIIAARKTVKEGKESSALNALITKHPDTDKIISDPRFVDWVGKSAYRTSTFRDAHENSNAAAADELFTEFKLQHPAQAADTTTETTMTTETVSAEEAAATVAQAEAVRNASTGAIVPAGGDTKKIYRRADLIKLKVEDPDRYETLHDEIYLAYKEKRVI